MVELGIVGGRNSGKTTLVETLAKSLVGLGYRVATVKHTSHDHTFDQPGKDSHRHRRAGAGMTLAISSSELALFAVSTEVHRQLLMDAMATQFDICLVEGDRSAMRPKLLVTRNQEADELNFPGNIVAVYGPTLPEMQIPRFAFDDIDGLVT
ncbi:MAG: molybdopterin-guanine dinucleotide biosynthesis protein B, partial [candidate division Zixibacteria bacterium]|nr:molybdopterin-guanine dinucleotide biosynthesis protein B [candidate division Zixibacteria bacterium]